MDNEFAQVPFGGQPFVDNPEPRCPCVLLIDDSYSMRGRPIQQVNRGLVGFKQDLVRDPLAAKRVEVGIVTFGPVRTLRQFMTVDEFDVPELTASDDTPMGEAILEGVEMVARRKDLYKQNGIAYYRPWIFLITDGAPTDGDLWKDAAKRVREGEASKAFSFFAVGVEGADMKVLNQISDRGALPLDGLKFQELFAWLSASLKSQSNSRVGETVSLAKPDGWSKV